MKPKKAKQIILQKHHRHTQEYDIYNTDFLESSIDDDEINTFELGFMMGYLGEINV